ncbi:MAG TPA: ERF family protein, partial [Massilibacterium sp.]|nr:ERF family protein [Massilibacterium sp.]
MSDLKTKIAELRTQIGAISKDKENPFFSSSYFDINQLLEALQPHLMELNLGLTQPLSDNRVYTIIEDLESNDVMESWLPLPEMNDPQKIGSAITYYRRYTLQSLLALQAEDDDGNKASGNRSEKSNSSEKEWLNESDKERWEKAEQWVKAGNDPYKLRQKYKVSKKDMEYFISL